VSRTLAGRGAVVTGAGRGIGAAIADALARAGAAVVVAGRSREPIEGVAAALRAAGARAWAVACDVTDEVAVRALAREARERLGPVDVLVNNAGVATSGPFHTLALEEWNRVLAVHATGTFLCAREFAPGMIERGWGRIVNIASVAGLAGARYVAHYSAAKHAVVGFTRSAGLELEGSGVTMHAVCPAYVDTPMTDHAIENVQTRAGLTRERALAAVLATTGQARLVTPAEVADAVLALCGPDAAARNGSTIVLDAGAVR
jgi:3-hydroxybutyrate dehydrogenase